MKKEKYKHSFKRHDNQSISTFFIRSDKRRYTLSVSQSIDFDAGVHGDVSFQKI